METLNTAERGRKMKPYLVEMKQNLFWLQPPSAQKKKKKKKKRKEKAKRLCGGLPIDTGAA